MSKKFSKKKLKNKQRMLWDKICRPPLPRQPNTWLLMIFDRERHVFYSVTEDRYYVRFVPELRNKCILCSYGGLMVLRDKSTFHGSIFNISTMEILQLPVLNHFRPEYDSYDCPPDCIMSSPVMDGSCRIIFFDTSLHKFKSCHLGDTEFIERDLVYNDPDAGGIVNLINFKGKLYALRCLCYNLLASDFSDPDLHFEQVISGDTLLERIGCAYYYVRDKFLVESSDDLLLILIDCYDDLYVKNDVSNVYIFRADFSSGEWVEVGTLGDRAIFLDKVNTFSSPASAFGLKSNALYWMRETPLGYGHGLPPRRHLYTYDINDKSFSISLPTPIVGTYSSLSWLSLPLTTCNEEKPIEPKARSSLLFEAVSTVGTNSNLQRQKSSTNLLITQPRKTKNKEDIVEKRSSLWADLPDDLLTEIFLRLVAGERVMFRSVCRSWNSVSSSSMTSQQLIFPLTGISSNRFSCPLLMCPDNKAYNPIYGELCNMEFFLDSPGIYIRAGRDGWLLMGEWVLTDEFPLNILFFYNPLTKAEITLPESDATAYIVLYFSAPPTSTDFLVVAVAMMRDRSCSICILKSIDEGWTYRDISLYTKSFCHTNCKAVVLQGVYYFLVARTEVLVFDPKKDQICLIEAPSFISHPVNHFEWGQEQYILESDDGKLIMVFVDAHGSSVYTFELNISTNKWEILRSLGNRMLFVGGPLSLCKKATVSGTGNKIYFPRFAGDSNNILFYSLATRKYHTFEMGSTYPKLLNSKFYPQYNGWWLEYQI